MRRATYLQLLLVLMIPSFFYGCGEYKTVGKVDMKRLVDIEELWAKRTEYEGKVITLKLRENRSGSVGWTDPIRGQIYHVENIMINLNGIGSLRGASDSIVVQKSAGRQGDTINIGTYEISLVHGAKDDGTLETPKIPEWTNEKPKILRIRKTVSDNIQEYGQLFDSNDRYISGLLIGGYSAYVQTDSAEVGLHYLETRCMVLLPTGFSYIEPKTSSGN